jgi:hypothetical protein
LPRPWPAEVAYSDRAKAELRGQTHTLIERHWRRLKLSVRVWLGCWAKQRTVWNFKITNEVAIDPRVRNWAFTSNFDVIKVTHIGADCRFALLFVLRSLV